MTGHRPAAVDAGAADVRRAWWSLALFPLALVAAFVVGEGLASLLGHPTGSSEDVPVWVMVVAGGTALLVFVAPVAVTAFFSRRAAGHGNPGGRAPVWTAVAVAATFVLLNVAQGIAAVLLR